MLSILIAAAVRVLLVALFLPFSALDKILAFDAAVDQAHESFASRPMAVAAIGVAFCIEVAMSLAIVAGVADRMAAFVLAGYCLMTAVLWKPFWKCDDFRVKGPSRARGLFWDFWKNVALAGGFLLITFGTTAASVDLFFAQPWSSTHPYTHAASP